MNDIDFKVKEIKPGPYDSLSISLDYETDPSEMYPVLLFTPDTGHFDHWHIEITRDQAASLRDWLNDYLGTP